MAHVSPWSLKLKEAQVMENTSSTLITVEEVCESLMIGKNAAYRLLGEGKLKGFRIGRIWKIPRESLIEFINRQYNAV